MQRDHIYRDDHQGPERAGPGPVRRRPVPAGLLPMYRDLPCQSAAGPQHGYRARRPAFQGQPAAERVSGAEVLTFGRRPANPPGAPIPPPPRMLRGPGLAENRAAGHPASGLTGPQVDGCLAPGRCGGDAGMPDGRPVSAAFWPGAVWSAPGWAAAVRWALVCSRNAVTALDGNERSAVQGPDRAHGFVHESQRELRDHGLKASCPLRAAADRRNHGDPGAAALAAEGCCRALHHAAAVSLAGGTIADGWCGS